VPAEFLDASETLVCELLGGPQADPELLEALVEAWLACRAGEGEAGGCERSDGDPPGARAAFAERALQLIGSETTPERLVGDAACSRGFLD